MVIYDLHCPAGHRFEGWFRNPEDFAAQQHGGLLQCPVCNGEEIRRLPSGCRVNLGAAPPAASATAAPASLGDVMVKATRHFVETHFEYVGAEFAEEARRIHRGEVDERAIWGRASVTEIRALDAEGIRTALLPRDAAERKKLN